MLNNFNIHVHNDFASSGDLESSSDYSNEMGLVTFRLQHELLVIFPSSAIIIHDILWLICLEVSDILAQILIMQILLMSCSCLLETKRFPFSNYTASHPPTLKRYFSRLKHSGLLPLLESSA